ncbi:FAD-dependent oxidoreductase [Halomicronema sp. CCY15110]|uniref:FAD-dependent oxidoreductase n=1 Tax=Halomicronema sp. CCY15110 TaxID=2767773 RepID=UPI001951AC44|nr:FAD-dependent oxidoreductase [Halomicronema sp. CCY15110]
MVSKSDRICIVGAGAAGLSTGYYLKQKGYEHVVVLEKQGRVGGLCCSVTHEGKSFDLGANYLTPAYKEVLALAQQVGADLYTEGPGQVYNPLESAPNQPAYQSIMSAVMQGTDPITYAAAVARYTWERLQLEPIVSVPGFRGISQHPDLTQSFAAWLEEKDLSCLGTLFEIPITAMGYGYLHEIPAIYALKYMTLETFGTLVTYGAGLECGWPKRFVQGFQRLWERVSWNLDVRLNVDIHSIQRGAGIEVKFSEREQVIDRYGRSHHHETFDWLILACPLTLDVLAEGDTSLHLDLSDHERDLFQQIVLNPYALTTYAIPDLSMPTGVTNVVPLDAMANPWFISQQFPDNDLIAFYSRIPSADWATLQATEDHQAVLADFQQRILAGIETTVTNLGGQLPEQYFTYDLWPYFPHVTSAALAHGFYDQLEAMQGQRHTFYVGGLMNFELVETIVEYTKALVNEKF